MKKTILLLAFLLSVMQTNYGQGSIYKIKSIKAFLFYNLNKDYSNKKVAGTISDNIIDNHDFNLWNTIIGEGSAEGPSSQILVVINIEGKKNTNEERTLKVTCRLENKVISTQEHEFSNFSQDPNYSYAVLLNDVGCGKVEILAEIINKQTKKSEDKIEKTIAFECGE